MEEIAKGECDSCGTVMEPENMDSSQGICVCGSEAIFLEGSMASEVTMLDVTIECPMWLFVNCCNFAVMLELGVPVVIPKEVSSDIDSCSVAKDVFPVDMSFVESSSRE